MSPPRYVLDTVSEKLATPSVLSRVDVYTRAIRKVTSGEESELLYRVIHKSVKHVGKLADAPVE
jgi:hypothetical protein